MGKTQRIRGAKAEVRKLEAENAGLRDQISAMGKVLHDMQTTLHKRLIDADQKYADLTKATEQRVARYKEEAEQERRGREMANQAAFNAQGDLATWINRCDKLIDALGRGR